MQTDIWMAYSNSMHFSDKLLYKILLILSYGSKDMNLAKFTHLQQFFRNRETSGIFSHRTELSPGR
jgi:hypothetical protein